MLLKKELFVGWGFFLTSYINYKHSANYTLKILNAFKSVELEFLIIIFYHSGPDCKRPQFEILSVT